MPARSITRCTRRQAVVRLIVQSGCRRSGRLPFPAEVENQVQFLVTRSGSGTVRNCGRFTPAALILLRFSGCERHRALIERDPLGCQFQRLGGRQPEKWSSRQNRRSSRSSSAEA